MPEEVLRYRAELDMSALQAQLAFARQDIGFAMQQVLGAPRQQMGTFSSAFNTVSSDVAAIAALPSPPQRFGLMEPAFQAAQQTGFMSSLLMSTGIPGTGITGITQPPQSVFASDFFAAERQAMGQRMALGAAGAGVTLGATAIGGAVGFAFGGPVGMAAGLGVGIGLEVLGGAGLERTRGRLELENLLQARMPSMSTEDRQRAAFGIGDIAVQNAEVGFDEARQLVAGGIARGAIRNTGNVDEFTRQSKQFIDDVLTAMKALNVTGDQAADAIEQLRRIGFKSESGVGGFGAQDALFRARAVAGMTGQNVEDVVGGGMAAAGGFAGTGIRGAVGFNMAAMYQAALDDERNRDPALGRLIDLSGGLGPAAGRVTDMGRQIVSDPRMTPFILGGVNEKGEFDRERFLDLVNTGTLRDASQRNFKLMRGKSQEEIQTLLRRTQTEFQDAALGALIEGPGVSALPEAAMRQFEGQAVSDDQVAALLQSMGFDALSVEMFRRIGDTGSDMFTTLREREKAEFEKNAADRAARENTLSAHVEKIWDAAGASIDKKIGASFDIIDRINTEMGERFTRAFTAEGGFDPTQIFSPSKLYGQLVDKYAGQEGAPFDIRAITESTIEKTVMQSGEGQSEEGSWLDWINPVAWGRADRKKLEGGKAVVAATPGEPQSPGAMARLMQQQMQETNAIIIKTAWVIESLARKIGLGK